MLRVDGVHKHPRSTGLEDERRHLSVSLLLRLFSHKSLLAIYFTHFITALTVFTLFAWLPTYFSEVRFPLISDYFMQSGYKLYHR